MIPIARTTDLHVEDVDSSVVVYDLRSDAVHSLNAVTTYVWRRCDGLSTVDEIASGLGDVLGRSENVDVRALVWLALKELEKVGLVETYARTPLSEPVSGAISRRNAAMKVGRAALIVGGILPIIKSIVAPEPANAMSAQDACSPTAGGKCSGTCAVKTKKCTATDIDPVSGRAITCECI